MAEVRVKPEGAPAQPKGVLKSVLNELEKSIVHIETFPNQPSNPPVLGTGSIVKFRDQPLLMTCNHVIPTENIARESCIFFGKENDGDKPGRIMVKGADLFRFGMGCFLTSPSEFNSLDVTLIAIKMDKVPKFDGQQRLELDLSVYKGLEPNFSLQEQDEVMLWQFPEEGNFGLHISPCITNAVSGHLFTHSAKTHRGSSGAPVFKICDRKPVVVGLHRGTLQNSDRRTCIGLATPIHAIWCLLEGIDNGLGAVDPKAFAKKGSSKGLDAVITSESAILKYKDDMIGQQKMLGTVLELGDKTDAILQGPNALNYSATLASILKVWMENSLPQVTWRDLVAALEKQDCFNGLVCDINKDHAYGTDNLPPHNLPVASLGNQPNTPSNQPSAQAHEMLKETCWMPFGLQTHEVFPSDSTVVLYLVPGTKNYLEKTIRLEVPGGAVKGPSLEVHTAVITCGPMFLPDTLQLASMVVYVDFKAENVSNSLILHLPDWKRKDGTTTSRCTVIRAEHDYDDSLEGYQFKVMASSSGKQPENDSISLDGHCSLFGKALREGEISSYYLAAYQPKSKEENRTKVQVVVTFKSVTWIKIFEKYNHMHCTVDNRIGPQPHHFEFQKGQEDTDPFLEVSFKENGSRELGWRADINPSVNKIYKKDVNYQELLMSRKTFFIVRSSQQRSSLRDTVETGVYPPVISCVISLYMDLHCEQQSMYVPLTVSGNIKREQTFEFLCTIPNQRKTVDSKAFAKKGSSQEGSREVPVKAESSGQAQQKLPSKPDVTFLDSPPNSPSNQPAQKIGLSSVQANQAPHNPPFVASQLSSPTDTDPSNQPAQVPIPQGTQPSSTSSTQAMAGVTSTSTTGLDAVISSVDEIMKLKDGMQAQQLFLGTVLGLTSDTTNAILCAPNACSFITTLTIILQTWMTLNPGATWRDLVTALEKNEIYNTVIYNIKKKFAK